jgi:hypothetical protein
VVWFRETEMDHAPDGRAGGDRGISLIDSDNVAITCSGDVSGACCPLPIDGADVVVRFAAPVAGGRDVTLPWAAAGDDHSLRMQSICLKAVQ